MDEVWTDATIITIHLTPVSGRACLISAPTGASVGGIGLGHVGWAYQLQNGQWRYGSTDGAAGAPFIPAGVDNNSWSYAGDWGHLEATFTGDETNPHDNGLPYYTQYRCTDVAIANIPAAATTVGQGENSGYSAADNNCLTKAVAILRAYGVPDLTDAAWTAPNYYFLNRLPGFESVEALLFGRSEA